MNRNRLMILPLAMLGVVAEAQITAFSSMQFGLEDPVLGNARYQGMAGAMSAIGGNSSVMKDNPGALATGTNSDINFTGNVYANNSNVCSFNVNDLSIVFNVDHAKKGYVSSAFGVGYNRVANLDRQKYTKGHYKYSDNNTTGESTDDNIEQGGIGELNIDYAGNINNIIFFGIGLSFSNFNYEQKEVYNMQSQANYEDINRHWLVPDDYLRQSSAWGFNFKAGVVVQPTNFMRIGASIQTPTRYQVTETWDFYCENGVDPETNEVLTDYFGDEEYVYNLHIPFKFTGALGFMIANRVNLGLEYSMRNYSQTWADIHFVRMRDLEQDIEDLLQRQQTAKVGLEVNVYKGLDLRLGYALSTAPMKGVKDILKYANTEQGGIINGLYVDSYAAGADAPRYALNTTGDRQYITAGFGYTGKHFYADFAYAHKISKDEYMEQIPNVRNVDSGLFEANSHDITNKSNNFTLTVGLRW